MKIKRYKPIEESQTFERDVNKIKFEYGGDHGVMGASTNKINDNLYGVYYYVRVGGDSYSEEYEISWDRGRLKAVNQTHNGPKGITYYHSVADFDNKTGERVQDVFQSFENRHNEPNYDEQRRSFHQWRGY